MREINIDGNDYASKHYASNLSTPSEKLINHYASQNENIKLIGNVKDNEIKIEIEFQDDEIIIRLFKKIKDIEEYICKHIGIENDLDSNSLLSIIKTTQQHNLSFTSSSFDIIPLSTYHIDKIKQVLDKCTEFIDNDFNYQNKILKDIIKEYYLLKTS